MTDLDQTGKLDETLVVVAAEVGRSPKITRSNAGREHWPDCFRGSDTTYPAIVS
jgi:hypothetical protein